MAKKSSFYYNFSSYNDKWIVPRVELQKGDVCSQLTSHSLSLLSKKTPKLSNSNIKYHAKIPKVNIVQPAWIQTLPTFSSC